MAATQLDIDIEDLNVGYSVRHVGEKQVAEVFLSDQLENGAGYSNYLGKKENLKALLEGTDVYISGELSQSPHNGCDSSCYQCLRDYYNAMYHPLLDWRLGRDLLDLLLGRDLNLNRWEESEQSLTKSFAEELAGDPINLDGSVSAIKTGGKLLIVRHPFESPTNGHEFQNLFLSARLDGAVIDAETLFPDSEIRFVSSFDLQRRPGWVLATHLQ